jgi:hypothetical protein
LEREEYAKVRETTAALTATFQAAIANLDAVDPAPARSRKR